MAEQTKPLGYIIHRRDDVEEKPTWREEQEEEEGVPVSMISISTDLSSLSKTSETSLQLLSVAFVVFGSLVFGLPSADSSFSKCDWSRAYRAIGHALTTGIQLL
ncbi:hypothetical protein Dsin_033137 [Dipteronia sinensis]|uniref:Uncharacterized protein n=1 Tax=Dipteronia sinensis TaxID=43782 RepID=A0AAD9ZA14_9ROSI|nr:hypothetical protein Dsin_033137 [Dipteronia sinensis]